jgi:hypothetical protein
MYGVIFSSCHITIVAMETAVFSLFIVLDLHASVDNTEQFCVYMEKQATKYSALLSKISPRFIGLYIKLPIFMTNLRQI